MNIDLLLEEGHKISKIALLTRHGIESETSKVVSDNGKQKSHIRNLVNAMYSNDIENFECELNESVQIFGVQSTIDNVIMPFLEKVKLTSYNNSTVEAHFVVTAVRKKIILGIEEITEAQNPGKSVLLFLLKDEHYDLVLLYLYYILKSKGFKVYYLGTNISAKNLLNALDQKSTQYLCCYIPDKKYSLAQYFEMLKESSNLGKLFLTYAENSVKDRVRQHSQIRHCRYNLLSDVLKSE